MFKQSTIDQILDRADIVEIIGQSVNLTKKGANWWGICPFHQDRKPSMAVSPSRQIFKCFSCKEGGNVITFIMKMHAMTFQEAIVHLAGMLNIEISKDDYDFDDEDADAKFEREQAYIINEDAQRFFCDALLSNDPKAIAARNYAFKRWGAAFCESAGIGYAPDSWDSLLTHSKGKGYSSDELLKLSLIRKKPETGRLYDFFRNRITIPIRDRWGRVIAFTARALDDSPAKYVNSAETVLFRKSSSLFGIEAAIKEGARKNKFYIVEGAPDVLAMQSREIANVVAPLGTALSADLIKGLRRHSKNICFIPDMDVPKQGESFGPGIAAVIKSGKMATLEGFNVTVIQLAGNPPVKKVDPDSFLKEGGNISSLREQEFLSWMAGILVDDNTTQARQQEVITEIAGIIAAAYDDLQTDLAINNLSSIFGSKAIWRKAVKIAKAGIARNSKDSKAGDLGSNVDLNELKQIGFIVKNNSYYGLNRDGVLEPWSNFIMKPLYHIEDPYMPTRIFELTNSKDQKKILELTQEELVSLSKFKAKVEGLGFFVWNGSDAKLNQLKFFLYDQTETAVQIEQLGWQPEGFWAFGNGIYSGQWHPVDEVGMVRLGEEGNFYFPAFNTIFKKSRKTMKFFDVERKFIHKGLSDISLHEYASRIIDVFGENAMIGLGFVIATLFRDIVIAQTEKFPSLNVFGQKSSGKTYFALTMQSFFSMEDKPRNINNSTAPNLAELIASRANAIVVLDEYRNDISTEKRELLKGLFDTVGRSRTNMDMKKKEITSVDCGAIICGQQLATADIALFSRCIFLSYSKTSFSIEEKTRFNELMSIRKRGVTHLIFGLLDCRKLFEADFENVYNAVKGELDAHFADKGIDDRVINNWIIPLAAFRTIHKAVSFPFSYEDMLRVSIDGITRQNAELRNNDELADFWNFVGFLLQDGRIFYKSDYVIANLDRIKCRGHKDPVYFNGFRKVLLMRFNRIAHLYVQQSKSGGSSRLDVSSLTHYLVNDKTFFGTKSQRFDVRVNGLVQYQELEVTGPGVRRKKATCVDWAYCFDYDMLCSRFGINLESEFSNDIEVDDSDD